MDDSRTMRKFMVNHLKKIGITEIFEASDGREALNVIFENLPIELVFLDINMPIMDGMECLQEIRESHHLKDIPVMMVTSESEKTLIEEVIKAGANDYLVKPFKFEQLRDKVRKFL